MHFLTEELIVEWLSTTVRNLVVIHPILRLDNIVYYDGRLLGCLRLRRSYAVIYCVVQAVVLGCKVVQTGALIHSRLWCSVISQFFDYFYKVWKELLAHVHGVRNKILRKLDRRGILWKCYFLAQFLHFLNSFDSALFKFFLPSPHPCLIIQFWPGGRLRHHLFQHSHPFLKGATDQVFVFFEQFLVIMALKGPVWQLCWSTAPHHFIVLFAVIFLIFENRFKMFDWGNLSAFC